MVILLTLPILANNGVNSWHWCVFVTLLRNLINSAAMQVYIKNNNLETLTFFWNVSLVMRGSGKIIMGKKCLKKTIGFKKLLKITYDAEKSD